MTTIGDRELTLLGTHLLRLGADGQLAWTLGTNTKIPWGSGGTTITCAGQYTVKATFGEETLEPDLSQGATASTDYIARLDGATGKVHALCTGHFGAGHPGDLAADARGLVFTATGGVGPAFTNVPWDASQPVLLSAYTSDAPDGCCMTGNAICDGGTAHVVRGESVWGAAWSQPMNTSYDGVAIESRTLRPIAGWWTP